MELNTQEMSVCDIIKVIMQIEHTNMAQLAVKMKSTPQNISQRLKHGNFRESDLIKFADALGYDVIIEFKRRAKS